MSRRWFLLLGGAALAGLIGMLRLEKRGARRPSLAAPTGLGGFPVLNVESGPPRVAAPDWVLSVDGLVENPVRLDRTAWEAMPRTRETKDFHCVEGWSIDRLRWEGVRVADVLRRAGPRPEGRFVTFHAYGGSYADSLTLAEALAPATLLADTVEGVPLPAAHGGPLRLVIPSQLGYKNVKWVVRLEVTARRATGYWEMERHGGYPAEAPVP